MALAAEPSVLAERAPADLLCNAPNIAAVLAMRAASAPDKPAVILELQDLPAQVLTYGTLCEQSQCFAAGYRDLGLPRGSIVIIMLGSHISLPASFFGAIMAGMVPTLFPPASQKINPALFWQAQAATFERIGASLIVTSAADAADLARLVPGLATPVLDIAAVPAASPDPVVDPATPDEIACLQHSSGTTGAKKGVILTHGMLMRSVASLAAALRMTEDDIIVSWLPLYHDMGLINCLFLPILLGLTTVHLNPFEWVASPPLLLEAIGRHRATLCWMPNFAFHHLIRTTPRQARYDLSSLRALIDAAEPCKPETLARFAERYGEHGLRPLALQVGYGMAENVCIATQTDLDAVPRTVTAGMNGYTLDGVIRPPAQDEATVQFLSCGKAIPGTHLRILDAGLAPLPDGRVGQIAVTSDYLFSGYFKQNLKPGTLVDGWYMSGDLGFMLDGELYVAGRSDDLLIVNGRNLYAHDVEFAINNATTVKPGRCVAVGPFSARLGSQTLVVIAETTDEDVVNRKALASNIRDLIYSIFGVVTHDVSVRSPGWLIKTTSGKISREANLRLYLEERPIA
ncbi:AMP-binding protein [Acidisoma cellulosilytica]|uniref:AMP-binding protein n=1 Tax=Acidisoma cellulosilyticum TaxID=2802395 RepID=A0A964E6A7_9PROT|nr:AMP-binding protein [Acidisoma cellulosilyticum]MCB8883366.1 AMP-binding protein [Acidisoma cellulosilyticum]